MAAPTDRLETVKIAVYVFSAIVSTLVVVMTWNVQRENERISHRLDVRDAYFNKALLTFRLKV